MSKKGEADQYKSRRFRLQPATAPTRCGGCGAEYCLPKNIRGSEIKWMLAGGWKIDAELMTIRCPACVAQAERQARVLAS